MSHCQLRCFIILYLSELSVLVLLGRFAQNSASKDTTFNTINGHLRRITNGLPNSFLYQIGKSTAAIHLPVSQEIGAAGHLLLYPEEDGLHDILYIYKRQVLAAEAHRSQYAAGWTLP